MTSSVRVVIVAGASRADIERVLATLPAGSKLAAIVDCAQPITKDLQATMKVVTVAGTTQIEAGKIYVVPADARVEVQNKALVVHSTAPNSPDVLMRTAADQFGAQTVGVILSGRGSAGVLGIKRIKEVGGITFAQAGVEGDDAEMPRNAIATGLVDLVLAPAAISSRLQLLADGATTNETESGTADTLRDILALIRARTGHDFASYKRATLYRRTSRRMQVCQVSTIVDYHTYLRDHPAEIANLLRDFLISVTSFFRDPESYAALAEQAIPKLFATRSEVRVWVSGCASGEEAYSLAILLTEHASRHDLANPIQIFATDIDEDSLVEARIGRYPETIAVDVSRERLDRFFTREQDRYRINNELRDLVLFSPHNLLRDPPFSRLDLVSCRNLMIYLNRDAQDRVLNLFHFGLRPDGFLFVGTSESADNSSLFAAIDPKHRLFQRQVAVATTFDGNLTRVGWHTPSVRADHGHAPGSTLGELHYRVVESYAPPSILVSGELDILHVSEHAGRFLEIQGGEPTKQILRLALPALRLDLRTAISVARAPGPGVDTRVVKFDDNGKTRVVEIKAVGRKLEHVAPGSVLVLFEEKDPDGVATAAVPHTDPTSMEPLVREMEDELNRTRDHLRSTIEQYETSNEELKASNEELQAINEELRSVTEELESSKEELQSVNEELTLLNHELKGKVEEVTHSNNDLQNLMSSTDIGVLFLDRELKIKRFTPRACDLFNVIPTDIGRPVAHVTHRLDLPGIEESARKVLANLRAIDREVATLDGRRYLMRILPYRSLDDRVDGVVVTFVDVTPLRDAVAAQHASEAALMVSEERLHLALQAAPIVILGVDLEGSVWGYARGKLLPADAAIQVFARGHADHFAKSAQSVLHSRRSERVELDVVVDGVTRTYDFRIEPTAAGATAVGFDITPGRRD